MDAAWLVDAKHFIAFVFYPVFDVTVFVGMQFEGDIDVFHRFCADQKVMGSASFLKNLQSNSFE